MKKFGLIGGTSWRSTSEYYCLINILVNDHFGTNANPPLRIASLNQREIHDLQRADDWETIAEIYTRTALELEGLGVEGIALCANTPHRVFDQLQEAVRVPILHIADAIGARLVVDRHDIVGLLGTKFSMEGEFLIDRLQQVSGVKTLVPPANAREQIQHILYSKLSNGEFDNESREFFLKVIGDLAHRGASAVVLACTEFPFLMKHATTPVPMVDSDECHYRAIVDFILGE